MFAVNIFAIDVWCRTYTDITVLLLLIIIKQSTDKNASNSMFYRFIFFFLRGVANRWLSLRQFQAVRVHGQKITCATILSRRIRPENSWNSFEIVCRRDQNKNWYVLFVVIQLNAYSTSDRPFCPTIVVPLIYDLHRCQSFIRTIDPIEMRWILCSTCWWLPQRHTDTH